tara:strand:+ start:4763 stop:5533 length:771 start_codon:yes stop_codon:yes gene_type:complete
MKVIVKYDPAGRMGNRMFQYTFGYILSKLKGCNFYHDALPNFGIDSTMHNVRSLNNAINTRQYGDQYADMEMLVDHKGDIVIDSFLQQSRFYIDYRDELRSLFKIKDLVINKDKLILHIRETDFVTINAFLGYDYYKKLISDCGYKNVVIVTDNSKSNTVQKLIKEDGCTLSTSGVVDTFTVHSDSRAMVDFKTLMYSENIAISQSSFSWWAAFLGNHNHIIFPFKKDIKWWPVDPGIDDIDLYFNIDNVTKKYLI